METTPGTPSATGRDIETRADCELLARTFYGRAFADERLGPIFVDIAELDLEAHLPVITDFWEAVLLGSGGYGGGAFAPHWSLHQMTPLTPALFNRWLGIWFATVDELFDGPLAERAKHHAARVATAFSTRLAQLDALM